MVGLLPILPLKSGKNFDGFLDKEKIFSAARIGKKIFKIIGKKPCLKVIKIHEKVLKKYISHRPKNLRLFDILNTISLF